MSKIFGQNVDFNKNESLNFRFGNLIGFPSLGAGDAGYSFFHSGNAKFYGWDGTGWTELGLGGAGGADGVISNVALSGSDLVFTGSGGGFNGSVPLSSLGGGGGTVDDTAYGSSWNGDTVAAPSRNAIYDEIELLRGTYVDTTTNQTVGGNKTITGFTNFTGFQTSVSNILQIYGASSSMYLSPSNTSNSGYTTGYAKLWVDTDGNFNLNKHNGATNKWGYTLETQNTDRRNYLFPNKSGTVAMLDDIGPAGLTQTTSNIGAGLALESSNGNYTYPLTVVDGNLTITGDLAHINFVILVGARAGSGTHSDLVLSGLTEIADGTNIVQCTMTDDSNNKLCTDARINTTNIRFMNSSSSVALTSTLEPRQIVITGIYKIQ